jgi:ComF family protein
MLCGAATGNPGWCDDCATTLPLHAVNHCPVCALPTLHGNICGHCLQHPPHFVRTVAAYNYQFPLDKLVQSFKYGNKFHLSRQLAQTLAEKIEHMPDCLIAMPLHAQRLQERGYNQSLLLAQQLGRHLRLPVLPLACRRIRNTPFQSALPWKARSRNLHNAFQCSAEVNAKHVAIVDDVMTTGASVDALAKALLQAGAREISVWVVARTLPNTP